MRGEGQLKLRGKTWYLIHYVDDPNTGKRRQKWQRVGRTLRAAEKARRRILNQIEEGAYVEPTKITVAELLDRWLQDVRARVRLKTLERYTEVVETHLKPALGQFQVRALRPEQISAAWAEALATGRRNGSGGLSPQTVKHHHRILSQALKRAARWRMIPRNPAEMVDPPRPQRKEMLILNDDEATDLLCQVERSSLHIPVLLALTTGMRRGEILGLRWRDVDLHAGALAVTQTLEQTKEGVAFRQPKTSRSRRNITLPEIAVEPLRRHKAKQAEGRLARGLGMDRDALVVCRPDGQPLLPGSVTRDFARTIKRLDLPPVRFHDLRHTHISLMLLNGEHPKVASARAGHASVAITMDTYSHVMPELAKESAQRIDALLRTALERKPAP